MYELQENEMIFVFTGPDGSGRKTLAKMAGSTLGMLEVLSYTTREPRSGEVDGQDYHFITREEFAEAERQGEFVESVERDGVHYGIKTKDLEEMIHRTGSIYMVFNRHGADIMKKLYGDQVARLFIYADRATVEERQKARGDSSESIAARLAHYEEEMDYMDRCEHAFQNDESAHTIFALTKVLESYLNRNWVDKD